jgi:hypothetical protein
LYYAPPAQKIKAFFCASVLLPSYLYVFKTVEQYRPLETPPIFGYNKLPEMARWQNGDAEDCKSLNAGSIPARASNRLYL